MTRTTTEFPLIPQLAERLAHLASEFPVAMVLNSNRGAVPGGDRYGSYDFLAAFGEAAEVNVNEQGFEHLQQLIDDYNDWIFCALSYDLKNETENLHSENHDGIRFPLCRAFIPLHVVAVPSGSDKLFIHSLAGKSADDIAAALKQAAPVQTSHAKGVALKARTGKKEYVEKIEAIQKHIQRGDIYEMNYCLEFFSEHVSIQPATTWLALNERSPMPFSCYFHAGDYYLLCASPERFLKKTADKIISQPIKGTARRGQDSASDEQIRQKLAADKKERAENVMIVDLVRNDLSRTALRGSVRVEELMGIHTFPALHQMISTVTSRVDDSVKITDIIKAAFPMGSMTGAPKVRAMQLIEEYENARRGLFSGAVGYITPGGDFDLNVVIRSIQYKEGRYLSCQAGSAITIQSEAEKEYEECLLKAQTMMNALAHAG